MPTPGPWKRQLAQTAVALTVTVLLGVLISATLVRSAPGFVSDERLLDPRLSEETKAAIRAERADRGLLSFYFGFLARAVQGDFGVSQSLQRPVAELLRERTPVTFRIASLGLLIAWTAALGLALAASATRLLWLDLSALMLAGLLLCIPTAVLALGTASFQAPTELAVALIVLPRLFRYCRNLLARSYTLPHIITARAKGLGELRVLAWHVLPSSLPQIVALVGVSVSMAFGACIPVEALCGVAGVGQLAWLAAMGRDLPLLVSITMVVIIITLLANAGSDLVTHGMRLERPWVR